jgi:hypothetical protein
MVKKLSEIITERIEYYKHSYIPVFKADCEGRPYHYGTMCAITIDGFSALVTASHVLERDKDNKCDVDNLLYLFKNGEIKQLPDCDSAALPLTNPKEMLDLAVLIPRGWKIEDVVSTPIVENQFRKRNFHEKLYVGACGFPVSKNKRNGNELQSRPYGYFGLVANDVATTRAGYDSQFYFSFQIDLKRVYRGGQKKVKAPAPYGISGGPVFVAHDFIDSNFKLAEFAGIVVAKDKSKKHIVCVKGSFVFSIINELRRLNGVPFNVLQNPT